MVRLQVRVYDASAAFGLPRCRSILAPVLGAWCPHAVVGSAMRAPKTLDWP